MTTFPNAAPPPGALFDNVPTVAVTEKYAATFGVSAEHARTLIEGAALEPAPAQPTPATRIAQVRGGRWVAVDVFMQYGAPIPLDLALRRVEVGRTVFVAREDAGTVLEAVTRGESIDGNGVLRLSVGLIK